jgi:hypothetical protein
MDIPVGKQPDEMDRSTILRLLHNIIPDTGLKDPSRFERRIDKSGALVKDPPGPDGIVPDLAVPHVIIRGQSDCCTMGREPGEKIGFEQLIQIGCMSFVNSIRFIRFAQAYAVHDDQQQRAFSALKGF